MASAAPALALGLTVSVGAYAGYRARDRAPPVHGPSAFRNRLLGYAYSAGYGAVAAIVAAAVLLGAVFVLSLLGRALLGGPGGLVEFVAPIFTVGTIVTFLEFLLFFGLVGVAAGSVGGLYKGIRATPGSGQVEGP